MLPEQATRQPTIPRLRDTGEVRQFESMREFLESDDDGYVRIEAERPMGKGGCFAFKPCGDGGIGDQLCEPRDFVTSALFWHRLSEARVLFPYHLLWTQEGTKLSDLSIYKLDVDIFPPARSELRVKSAHVIGTNNNFHNYAHWLTECLPAYHLPRILNADDASWLSADLREGFHTPSLGCFGIDPGATTQVARGTVVLESLFFSSCSDHARDSNVLWPTLLIEIAQTLSAWSRAKQTAPTADKIYISRSNSPRRRCRTESALETYLASIGFQIIRPEALPLEHQIALFESATIVVGTHGAGLANIIFCRPGTLVVELQSPGTESSHFLRLAFQFGLRHCVYRQTGDSGTYHHADWDLDVEDFRYFLFQLPGMNAEESDP